VILWSYAPIYTKKYMNYTKKYMNYTGRYMNYTKKYMNYTGIKIVYKCVDN